MALSAVIKRAEELLELDGERPDFDAFIELVYQDLDFELLFDPKWDGVVGSEYGERLGMANLEFKDWFGPFRDEIEGVHPYTEGDIDLAPRPVMNFGESEEAEGEWQPDNAQFGFGPMATSLEKREVSGEWKCGERRETEAAICKVCGSSNYSQQWYGSFRVTLITENGEECLAKVEDFMETTYVGDSYICNVCGNADFDRWIEPWGTLDSDQIDEDR